MTFKERLDAAREAYLANPTRRLLRLYLIYKARTGVWDERYCRYYDVDPNVNEGCRRFIIRGYAEGLVPTSTLRFPIAPDKSYHRRRNEAGEGMAVDMGLIEAEVGTALGRSRMIEFQRAEFNAFKAGGRPRMIELIGPYDKEAVFRGVAGGLVHDSPLENQHDTHVHGAFSG